LIWEPGPEAKPKHEITISNLVNKEARSEMVEDAISPRRMEIFRDLRVNNVVSREAEGFEMELGRRRTVRVYVGGRTAARTARPSSPAPRTRMEVVILNVN
jgi:hypothetical protein